MNRLVGQLFVVTLTFSGCQCSKPAPTSVVEVEAPAVRAHLKTLIGTVKVKLAGDAQFIPAKAGMELHPNDEIQTLAGGFCMISFEDGKIVRLSENTNAKIPNANQDEEEDHDIFVEGQADLMLTPGAQAKNFIFKTNDAKGKLSPDSTAPDDVRVVSGTDDTPVIEEGG